MFDFRLATSFLLFQSSKVLPIFFDRIDAETVFQNVHHNDKRSDDAQRDDGDVSKRFGNHPGENQFLRHDFTLCTGITAFQTFTNCTAE